MRLKEEHHLHLRRPRLVLRPRRLGVHRVLVVTSDYHTRRALHTLRARWPGINICMVAAPDEFFSAYGWWHTREGRKTFFLECSKTLASMVGM